MKTDTIKHYGKFVAAGAVGVGLGAAGLAYADTPVQQTNTYQNLQDDYQSVQDENSDLEAQVADLQTTVTNSQERADNLEAQVTQFNETVNELRDENADLEDAVAQAQERVGLVDYLPVFSDEDVELQNNIKVFTDVDDSSNEGDYDRIDVNYESNDGQYDVTVTEYEESEDADDAVEDFEDGREDVVFTEDGDERTVEVAGYSGELDETAFHYDDDDAVEDVQKEDIESVTVDGEDVTNRVESVDNTDGSNLRITFENGYYVNQGETVSVTYSDAGDGELDESRTNNVWIGSQGFYYDLDEDTREDIYRDGNTVVELEGTEEGDEDTFEAQYEDLRTQYE